MDLQTKRLRLRDLLPTDLDKIHELHSLPETDEFNTTGIPDTIETTRQLLSEWLIAQNELPRKKYVFCFVNSDNEFIGLIGLNIGRPAYKNAEIWFKLHSKYWNQGFATEAVNGILRFSFADLKLQIELNLVVRLGIFLQKEFLKKLE